MLEEYKLALARMYMGTFSPQTSDNQDAIARILTWVTRLSLIGAISLLPIFFLPFQNIPLLDGKVYVVAVLLSIALIVSALLVLRVGTLDVPASASIAAAWLVLVAAAVSAGLSGDISDSLTSIFSVGYTVSILGIGFLLLTVVAVVARHYVTALWVGRLLYMVSGVLLWWHVVRLLSGWDLSFGLFPTQTSSPFGNWADVALIAAGFVLVSLLVVGQTALALWQRALIVLTVMAATFILLVINSTWLWVVLGVVSLTVVVMAITRRQNEPTQSMLPDTANNAAWLLATAGVVFVGSLLVLLGGSNLQGKLSTWTDSTYVEVRPSMTASLDIVRNVWSSELLTGVGPNRYADAWRVHKSEAINQTIFWNSNFNTGHSFMMTQAVENGLLGVIAWLAFFALLIVSGVRTFLLTTVPYKDTAYTLALVSFIVGLFVWVSTFFVNIGVPVFLLGLACTGLYIGLSFAIRPRQLFSLSLVNNQKLSFVVVATLVLTIIVVVWFLQQMTEQLSASTAQNRILSQSDVTVEEISQALSEVFTTYQNDTTARADALLHIARMQQLISVENPTAEQQQAFQQSSVAAINSSNVAARIDPTNPDNWYTQARAYILLARAEVEGASERAQAAIDQLKQLDPKSPQPDYLAAELAVIASDAQAARAAATAAIQKKRDYTPALTLLAQIEIGEGNVGDAIAVTESVLSFEPQNPARWYQLAVLYQANQQTAETLAALDRAIALDADYANALYVRSIVRYNNGDADGAEADMQRVLELNPDNASVQQQLEVLRSGVAPTVSDSAEAGETLSEETTERDPENISDAADETDLITTTTNTGDTEEEAVTE